MLKSQVVEVHMGERRLDTKHGRRRIVGIYRRRRDGTYHLQLRWPSDALYHRMRAAAGRRAMWYDANADDMTVFARLV